MIKIITTLLSSMYLHKKALSVIMLALILLLTLVDFDSSQQGSKPKVTTDQLAKEMSQRIAFVGRASKVNHVIPRFNQAKSLGCFDATFQVNDKLADELKQGVFASPKTYRAKLRFASASTQDDSKKDLRGLSIKIYGVDGKPLWGETGLQDFLLNSYPALFVGTPEDFLAFIKARQDDKKLRFFINPFDSHLKSLWILLKARKKHKSPFDIRYWSTTPFKHGIKDSTAVKYSITPCSTYQTKKVVEPGENQLRAAMKAHLEQGSACFNFAVQKRNQPNSMPIEDASVVWDEDDSPFLNVATITIKKQPFYSPGSLAACEKISFNPWQGLAEHRPLGRMNEVRRETYSRAAKTRNMEVP